MTEATMSPAEILAAADQASSFLLKLQEFPRLARTTASILQGQAELEKRVSDLRDEEANARIRLDAIAQSINDASERAKQAYAAAMSDQSQELVALQSQVNDLSATASSLRLEVQDLQAKRDELAASLAKVSRALNP